MKRLLFVVGMLSMATPVVSQQSLLPTLQRLRAEYPTPMSQQQLGEYLNQVAWEHRAEGWGMYEKSNGCPTPQGVRVSCDILLHNPSLQYFDVLIDVEGSATPTWPAGEPCGTDSSGGCDNFVAPVSTGLSRPTGLRVVSH